MSDEEKSEPQEVIGEAVLTGEGDAKVEKVVREVIGEANITVAGN
jgi:hypothetical protein